MATLEIEVPEAVREQLRTWAAAGKIPSEQEFLAGLIIGEVERLAWLELGALLDEGVRAPKVEMQEADWEALLQRVEANVRARRAANVHTEHDEVAE